MKGLSYEQETHLQATAGLHHLMGKAEDRKAAVISKGSRGDGLLDERAVSISNGMSGISGSEEDASRMSTRMGSGVSSKAEGAKGAWASWLRAVTFVGLVATIQARRMDQSNSRLRGDRWQLARSNSLICSIPWYLHIG
jgi:hypothetical protein